ncbi:hypothetical protein [Streptomyces atroolivaceus]|uniref:hypothetical protein n=1 Tax=Streptomyces atroolivaceus TaxID=66869 RepID=UPI0020255A1C|nr:hypothetical protein [Streptomyces atroolivaceus]
MSQASSPPDILSPAGAAGPYGACRAMRESAPLHHLVTTGSVWTGTSQRAPAGRS